MMRIIKRSQVWYSNSSNKTNNSREACTSIKRIVKTFHYYSNRRHVFGILFLKRNTGHMFVSCRCSNEGNLFSRKNPTGVKKFYWSTKSLAKINLQFYGCRLEILCAAFGMWQPLCIAKINNSVLSFHVPGTFMSLKNLPLRFSAHVA